MQTLRETFARLTAAIYVQPDPREAWEYVEELNSLVAGIRGEAADFRAYLAVRLQEYHGMSDADLAVLIGGDKPISIQRVRQILARARQKGSPVTNPTTVPVKPPLVLAIVTSPAGVLVADRNDKVPPVTFPGGDARWDESPAQTATRRVLEETGLTIEEWEWVGQRPHPSTSRQTMYVRAETTETDLNPGDPEDLSNVRWGTVKELVNAMPDMYQGARDFLNLWQDGRSQ